MLQCLVKAHKILTYFIYNQNTKIEEEKLDSSVLMWNGSVLVGHTHSRFGGGSGETILEEDKSAIASIRYMLHMHFLLKIFCFACAQAYQVLNSGQLSTTTVTFTVVKRSQHPPEFVKKLYEGRVSSESGQDSIIFENNFNRPLKVQALDADFANVSRGESTDATLGIFFSVFFV